MRNIKFLKKAVHEVVTAQHTVFHTAPIYEEDILDEEELEEMSSGGVCGTGSVNKYKHESVKRDTNKKWRLYSNN